MQPHTKNKCSLGQGIQNFEPEQDIHKWFFDPTTLTYEPDMKMCKYIKNKLSRSRHLKVTA